MKGISAEGVAGYASVGRADGFFLVFERLDSTLSQRLSHWKHTENKQSSKSSSFFSLIRSKSQKSICTFDERIRVAYDIAEALCYLHQKSILFRDLKPGNIGFDRDGTVKVFDFGLAVELPHSGDENQLYNLAGNTGTARYMAVEVIRNQPYGLKADVYSFATLLCEILSLKKPFAELSGPEVKEWVSDFGNRPTISRSWPTPIRRLLKNCWEEKIELRPTISTVRDTLANSTSS